MATKLSGGKAHNRVKATTRNLREESFFKVGKRNTPRPYDITAEMLDGTTSHNGAVTARTSVSGTTSGSVR